jgi:Kelch motif
MKVTRTIIVVVVVAGVLLVGVSTLLLVQGVGPGCAATWGCGASYPSLSVGTYGVAGVQCVAGSSDIYCIGGIDSNGIPSNEVYAGAIASSGNITSWTQEGTYYPQTISGQSCVASSGYIYCVAGFHDAAADDTNSSYYAQILGNGGLGAWYYATPYPIPGDSISCVTASSYIYCVGGNNETDGTDGTVAPSSTSWYAQLSSTGIGPWSKTAPFPASSYLPSCAEDGGYIYCVGGSDSSGNPLTVAYYAPLSSSGIGSWSPTTPYPFSITGPACVAEGGYIYCVGGASNGGESPSYINSVYYAPVSSSGIGTWTGSKDYPYGVGTSCAVTSTTIYCVGGFDASTQGEDNSVWYADLSSLRQ